MTIRKTMTCLAALLFTVGVCACQKKEAAHSARISTGKPVAADAADATAPAADGATDIAPVNAGSPLNASSTAPAMASPSPAPVVK